MVQHNYEKYQTLEINYPYIPERTVLYPLEPIGIGTNFTESIISYLVRLAKMHSVFTGTLLNQVIIPNLKKNYKFKSRTSAFDIYAYGLNGVGEHTKDLVNVLEKLTYKKNLQYLTMLTWSDVIQWRGSFRNSKAWCPECYQEWLQEGKPIYDPLIWSFNLLGICSKHNKPLLTRCPKKECNRKIPFIKFRAVKGFCPYCQSWLGQSYENPSLSIEDEIKYQIWIANNIGKLITQVPKLLELPNISASTAKCLELFFGENKSLLAQTAGTSCSKVIQWRSGKAKPTLERLFQLCYQISLPVADFMSANFTNLHSNDTIIIGSLSSGKKKVEFDLIATKKFHSVKIRLVAKGLK